MTKQMKKQVMFYTLTALLDNCSGKLEFTEGSIKEAFNDKDQVVKVRYADGREELAYDANPTELEKSINCWRAEHPEEFDRIILKK